MSNTPYVAQERLRWGDRIIEPGESVPVEPGRNYPRLIQRGAIVHRDQVPLTREQIEEIARNVIKPEGVQ